MKNNLLILLVVDIVAFSVGCLVGESISTSKAGYEPKMEIVEVDVTAYSPSPAHTDSTPLETASGREVKPCELEQLRYVAVSRDLKDKYNLKWGDIIWIAFTVEDTMNRRIENTVDLFLRNISLARKFGRQKRSVVIERK